MNDDQKESAVKKKKKKKKKKKRSLVISDKNNTFTAIEKNDLDLLQRIYASYPNDIKRKDKNKNSVLHHCVKHNAPKLIEFLLPKLPPKFINSINFRHNTPMLIATFERNIKCMDALYSCDKKAKKYRYRPNLDMLNINGRSCLIFAAMRDDAEIIEYLLTKCDPPPNIDHFDAKKNHKTALMFAVEHNKYNAVRILIEYGASFNIRNKLGKTARDEANCMKNIKCFRLLLSKERENIMKSCKASEFIQRYNVPDYLIKIIIEYTSSIPPEWLHKGKKLKKKRKGKKRN